MSAAVRIEQRSGGWAVMPILAAALASGGIVVHLLHLDRLPMVFCFFKAATGIPCMTCGSTRALARLAHLDVFGAMRVNPLATIALSTVIVLGLVELVLWMQGRTLSISLSPRQIRWSWVLAGLLLMVNWVYLIRAGV
jgi:hypothetical protein